MKDLFEAGNLLLLDMASTFCFLVLFLLTRNIPLSVILGGLGQPVRSARNYAARLSTPASLSSSASCLRA
jgi:hypothetical protein